MRSTARASAVPFPDGDLAAWRQDHLLRAGFEPSLAREVARDCAMDLHALIELVESGCPPATAVRILAPLENQPC
jgi:hypothetical protein